MAGRVTIVDGVASEPESLDVGRYTADPSTPPGLVNVPGFGHVAEDVAERLALSGDLQKDEATGEYSRPGSAPQPAQEEGQEAPQEKPAVLPKGTDGESVLNIHDHFGQDVNLLADAMAGGMQDVAAEAVAGAANVSFEEAQEAVATAEREVRMEVNGVLETLGINEADFDAVAEFATRNAGAASEIARAALSGGDLEAAARRLGRAFLSSRGR